MLFSVIAVILSLGALVHAETRKEDSVQPTSFAGGPHGTPFDDFAYVNDKSGHMRLASVTIGPCGGGPLTYLKFTFRDWTKMYDPVVTVEHGTLGPGLVTKTLDLHINEHIKTVIIRTNKAKFGAKWKTRISGLQFDSDGSPLFKCGRDGNKETVTWTPPEGRAFLYFSGASGDAIDNLMGHTIPVTDY